jgi:pilus assembly protein FimV
MLRKLGCAFALIPALWLVPAHALGLGDVDVRSKLNQRFSAIIPVVDATPEDIESLTVRLASAADFERGGVDRADYLTTLTFSLDPAGRVVVSSKQISREPLLNFIVEARWRGGRVLREYTVFLDPPANSTDAAEPVPAPAPAPVASSAPVVTPAPVSAPSLAKPASAPKTQAETAPAVRAPAPVAKPEPAMAAPSAEGGTRGSYGPVAPQETLWSIGTKVRPSADITMDQVLLALYETNPEAFVGGINGLQKNVTLRVPDAARMQTVDADTAKARVARLRSGRSAEPAKSLPPVVKAPVAAPVKPKTKSAVAPAASAAPAKSLMGDTDAASVADRLASVPSPKPKSPVTATVESPPPATNRTATVAPSSSFAPAAAAEPATASGGGVETSTPAKPAGDSLAATPSATSANTANPAAASATPSAAPAAATPAPAVTSAAPVTPAPAPAPATASAVAAGSNGDLLDGLLVPILVIVVILLLIGLLLWRRRQAAKVVEPPPVALTPKANLRTAASIGAAAGAAAAVTILETPKPSPVPSILDTPDPLMDAVALNKPVASSSLGLAAERPEFDRVAAAKEARPVSLTLDSNDPLSEADFHLAYGLFDESAALLKNAIAKDPNRVELQTKLAETYFAAGKSLEFQETAEALQGRLPDAEWQKIVGMGRKLSPGVAVFKDDKDALEPDLDLSFDSPAEPVMPAASAPAAAASIGSSLIDFDLEKELLNAPVARAPTKPLSEPEKFGTLDLSEFDLGGDTPKKLEDVNTIEFNLDELDLSQPAASEASAGFGDEVGTKLDLARAYSDMGDNEAARGLLDEVIAGGSVTQKQEAEALLKRLSA